MRTDPSDTPRSAGDDIGCFITMVVLAGFTIGLIIFVVRMVTGS